MTEAVERLNVRRGDRFVQRHPGARWPLFVEVRRVARDGSWCDIRCCTWAVMWSKRMPKGIGGDMADPTSPMYLQPENWTLDDVGASGPGGRP